MKETLQLTRDSLSLYGLLEGPDIKDIQDGAELPLVLILHGFNTSCRQNPFYRLTKALWKKNFLTLRFDFCCHGRSEGDMTKVKAEDFIKDAEVFFSYADNLPFVGEIFLVGYSMGGIIASHLAVMHKERVSKLVLFSPAADIQHWACEGFLFGTSYDPENPPEILETEQFRVGKPYLQSAKNIIVYDHLKELKIPALLVYGEEDEYVPAEFFLRYQEYLKDLKVAAVPEAGHLWMKNAEVAVQEITDFLEEDSI